MQTWLPTNQVCIQNAAGHTVWVATGGVVDAGRLRQDRH